MSRQQPFSDEAARVAAVVAVTTAPELLALWAPKIIEMGVRGVPATSIARRLRESGYPTACTAGVLHVLRTR